MFVVNANTQNNWFANSSASWYYDTPMDWSTYNMFNASWMENITLHACFLNAWTNVGLCFYKADWARIDTPIVHRCCNSVLSYACAQSFDNDVIFPYTHINWNNATSFQSPCIFIQLQRCGKDMWNYWNQQVMMHWILPKTTVKSVVSRKVFNAWMTVWKSVYWFVQTFNWLGCYDCYNVHICPACPLIRRLEIWLLHEDWSKNCFYCCDICSNYIGCFCYTWFNRFMYWKHETDWLVTQEWDRIYYDILFPEQCFCYRSCYTCTTTNCVNNYYNNHAWMWNYDMLQSVGTTICKNGSEYRCSSYMCCCWCNSRCWWYECSTGSNCRFTWIQISLN